MKPNVIIFCTDQQRHDSLGAYGNPVGLTPNFDGYAREGTLCETAITPQPICGPARACLQTGLYATENGCYRNGIPLSNREGNTTMAEYFAQEGYKTAYIGKWHLAGKNSGIVPEEERGGYQDWLGSNTLEFSSDAYDLVMYDNDNKPVKIPGHRIDGIADCAIDYIDRNQENPFLLFISPLEPHCQNHTFSYRAPRFTEDLYQGKWMPPDLAALSGTAHQHMAGYMALVKRLDEAFGRIMDALISLKLIENTLVVFTSDHGDHFLTRNSTNKMSLHEASVRIPLMFHGPGFEGGRILKEQVSLIDILPTLLDAAGLPPAPNISGRSIMPLLRGEKVSWPEEVLIQISETEVGRALRTKRWKYGVVAPGKDP